MFKNKSNDHSNKEIIIAAGGLVWRNTARSSEIIVVHRTRYGSEWTLPKGKPDPQKQETWQEVALREVKEETGCDAIITSFAGTIFYSVDTTLKVVLFWNMKVEGKCSFEPSDEVDAIEWLKPEEALQRLTYPKEKELLSKTYYNSKMQLQLKYPGKIGRIFRSIQRIFLQKRYSRLAGSLQAYYEEINNRICISKSNVETEYYWVKAVYALLEKVNLALLKNKLDEGWKYFHAAKRMEIFGYNDDEIKCMAAALQQETEKKLSKWRQKAVFKIIGNPESKSNSNTLNRENIYLATFIRDEHYDNTYHKISLRRANLLRLFFILILGMITIPILAYFGFFPENIGNYKTIISIEFFGILGASLSVAITLTKSSIDLKIPEQVIGSFVTWMRPVIGAIAAVAVNVFLHTGIAGKVFSMDLLTDSGVLIIAFVTGFSERVIMRVVKTVDS